MTTYTPVATPAAIVAAINDDARSAGDVVVLPGGAFDCSALDNLAPATTGVTIRGQGIASTTVKGLWNLTMNGGTLNMQDFAIDQDGYDQVDLGVFEPEWGTFNFDRLHIFGELDAESLRLVMVDSDDGVTNAYFNDCIIKNTNGHAFYTGGTNGADSETILTDTTVYGADTDNLARLLTGTAGFNINMVRGLLDDSSRASWGNNNASVASNAGDSTQTILTQMRVIGRLGSKVSTDRCVVVHRAGIYPMVNTHDDELTTHIATEFDMREALAGGLFVLWNSSAANQTYESCWIRGNPGVSSLAFKIGNNSDGAAGRFRNCCFSDFDIVLAVYHTSGGRSLELTNTCMEGCTYYWLGAGSSTTTITGGYNTLEGAELAGGGSDYPTLTGDILGEAPELEANRVPVLGGNCDQNGDNAVTLEGAMDIKGHVRKPYSGVICRGPVERQIPPASSLDFGYDTIGMVEIASTTEVDISLDPRYRYELTHTGIDRSGNDDTDAALSVWLSTLSATITADGSVEDEKYELTDGASEIFGPGISKLYLLSVANADGTLKIVRIGTPTNSY